MSTVLTAGYLKHVDLITAVLFVYKTMNWPSYLCTKKNPEGIELFSHVKTFFYSKQFAKLLTT